MSPWPLNSRRRFLGGAAVAGSLLLAGCSESSEPTETATEGAEEEVSPAEDLMREHGVLKRVLLVYRECIRRIDANEELSPDIVVASAALIRRFVEDYHEKIEEEFLFPRFRTAGKLVDLVEVLETQHQRGRDVTQTIQRRSSLAALKQKKDRQPLADSLHLFVRMYEPHEAREDTVLFPAFRTIVSPNEYAALGEEFENKEHQMFGDDGFEMNVDQVAKIEMQVGIYDLAQFTPPA